MNLVAVSDDDKIAEIWDIFIQIKASLREIVEMLDKVDLDALSDTQAVQYHLIKGKEQYMSGNFEEGIKSLNAASIIARNMEVKDSRILGVLYLHYGVMCFYRNDLNNAIHYYAISLDHLDNEINRTNIYNNIGDVYLELGNFEKAEEYLLKAQKIQKQSPYLDDIGIIIGLNLGRCASGKGQYEKAEQLLAPDISEELIFNILAEIYIARGDNYLAWGNNDKAKENYRKTVEISEKIENQLFKAKGLLGLSRLNLDKGEEDKFLKNCTDALEVLQSIKVNRQAIECIELLVQFYEEKKNYKKLHEIHSLRMDLMKSTDTETASLSLLSLLEKQGDRLHTLEKTNKLIRQQKEDLQDFTYATAHYLKEPLRNISSYSQILLRSFPEMETTHKEMFNFIIQNSNRADMLLLNMLSYLQLVLHPDRMIMVDTQKVAESVVYLLKHDEYKEIDFEVELKTLPKVFAEKKHISMLFKNLIDNCIKFRSPDRKCQITLGCSTSGGRDFFYVQDNGIGISDHYKEKIFKLFYTLENTNYESNAGAGLAICKKIISFYNGSIKVDSTYKNGCKIDFGFH